MERVLYLPSAVSIPSHIPLYQTAGCHVRHYSTRDAQYTSFRKISQY